ncbi:unnamed protein product [Staurois parvus]|uniref:Uncharacterized protein n=1 Tax=Staurois parvus TaxID=386267 RepID=A0ABN9GYA2_9NEOB|nr:unnamed protein product [Staurois parvus]
MHQAAAVIKRAWKKWKEKLEALAAVELDDILEMENTQSLSGSPAKVLNTSITNSMQDNPLITNEVVQSWNLGFVLSRAPPIRKIVIADGFHRHWYLLACLNVLNRNKGYKAEFIQSEHGIASIRALPQRRIKFHCKKSPLHFANICPEAFNCSVSGFNEILLEKLER